MKFLPLLLASTLCAPAAVLYREDFTHEGGGGEVTTGTVGWNSYYGTTAADIPSPTATPRMAIGNQPGSDNASPGYLFSQGSGTNQTYVAFEGTAFSIVPTDIDTITFMQGNSDPNLGSRILIQQNGNWYATSATFSTVGMTLGDYRDGSAELETFDFTLTASAWRAVTINPGVQLSLGAAIGSDLSSTVPITSIGFLTTSQTAVTRIDELSVNGIPEPSFASLLATGGLLAFRRRNRR